MGERRKGFLRGRAALWAGVAALTVASAGVIATGPQAGAAPSCGVSCFVAPTGSDSNTGLADSPLLTIQAGVDATSVGGTLHVAAGTYDEPVIIDHSMTLQGANAGVAGTGARGPESLVEQVAGESNRVFFVTTQAPVTIDGFRTQFSGSAIDGGVVWDRGQQLVFTNNLVDASAYESSLFLVADATLTNNLFTNISYLGDPYEDGLVAAWAGGGGGTHPSINVSGNTFSHLTGAASDAAIGLHGVGGVVSGNTFTNIDQPGVMLSDQVGNLTISNNLFDQIGKDLIPGSVASAAVRAFGSATYVGPVSVTGNTFSNDLFGVEVRSNTTTPANLSNGLFTVKRNAFLNNQSASIYVDLKAVGRLDGTCNWWGQASGPVQPGQSAGPIQYQPSLTSSNLASRCASDPLLLPSAPTHLSGVPGVESVKLTWTAPASAGSFPISGYLVTIYQGGVARDQRQYNSKAPHVVVYRLNNKETYSFRVAALSNGGYLGAQSGSSGAITVGAPGRPGKVKAVRGAAPGRLRISFTKPVTNGAKIKSYTAICTSTNGGATAQGSGTKTPVGVRGATVGKTYNCVVIAKNSRGSGTRSLPSANVVA